jgi:hemolysin III
MGWLSLLGIKYLLACVPTQGLILIGIGGLFYSIGVFFFVKGQTVPIYHAIWHLFVLSATIAHYFAVLFYVDHCEVVFH